eukprot:CFRG4956T1
MPLILLSPAKALDFSAHSFARLSTTSPVFNDVADEFVNKIKILSKSKLKSLLGVSETLTDLNFGRYQNWVDAESKPASLAFNGPAFQGLGANKLAPEDLYWAQERLRILSGLYGMLRPLDEIKPYRLDMSKALSPGGMHKFWKSRIALKLNEALEALPAEERFVVNCASQEYFHSVDVSELQYPVYTICLPGPSVFAKKARGAMVRHIIENRVLTPDGLKSFVGCEGEWAYVSESSAKNGIINIEFRRKAPNLDCKKENTVEEAIQTKAELKPTSKQLKVDKKQSVKRKTDEQISHPMVRRTRTRT